MLSKKLKKIKIKRKTIFRNEFLTGFLLMAILFSPIGIGANQVDELKSEISKKNLEMKELEGEITAWEKELDIIGQEKQSLDRDVKQLETTQKKLNSSIYLTNKQINTTTLKIEKLAIDIDNKGGEIEKNSLALAEALRIINEQESYSLLESMLVNDKLSELWNDLEGLQKVQAEIRNKTNLLKESKNELMINKEESEEEKENLSAYKIKLADQKTIVESNQSEKNNLLAQTKNKESNYQAILDEKTQLRQKLEAELIEYESQLEYILDKSKLPQKGGGVLAWPVENPYITQYFGLTSFALSGAYGYDKSGEPIPHRGVDFRASIGTPLLATASGKVRYTENMDAYSGCVSYGKWVLIDHENGLTTFYAHLSLIKVSIGQEVKRGDVIGYSGNTGYSTGPHLHFSVFDKSAVKVDRYTWSRGCKKAMVAYAPLEAYLNPMDYLPEY